MIVTFYSFKGGVGRSMALANVASLLRDKGLRVVVVDWDLEAPGLENYLADAKRAASLRNFPGLLDLILGYMAQWSSLPWSPGSTATAPTDDVEAQFEGWNPELEKTRVATLKDCLPSIAYSLQPLGDSVPIDADKSKAGLWILTAGKRDKASYPEYADSVQMFDWSGLYLRYYGSAFFEWLRVALNGLADVTLIDSRTGVTEMGGICTRQLADVVVAMCAPNESNLAGMERAIELIKGVPPALRSHRPLKVVPIVSRVDEQGATPRLTAWRDDYLRRITAALGEDAQPYWDMRMPYISEYSFTEKVIVEDPGGSELLKNAYERLAGTIVRRFATQVVDKREVLARLPATASELRELLVAPEADGEAMWKAIGARHEIAKRLLLRLVRVGNAGEGADRAAPVALSTLTADEQFIARDPLLSSLVVAREVQGVPSIELSFRSIDQWPRLARWVDEHREFLLRRQQLEALHAAWEASGKDSGTLPGGTALQHFEEFATTHSTELGPALHGFLGASRRNEQRIEAERAKATRVDEFAAKASRSRWISITLAILTVAVIFYEAFLSGPPRSALLPTGTEQALAKMVANADEAIAAGRGEDAFAAGNEIVTEFPKDPRGYFARGRALSLLDKRQDAARDFDKAIELGGDSDVFVEASRNLIQGSQTDQALEMVARGLKKHPRSSALWLVQGQQLMKGGKAAEARQSFDQAIAADGKNYVAFYERGKILADMPGKAEQDQAKSDLETAAKLADPNTQQAATSILKRLGSITAVSNPLRIVVQYHVDDGPKLANAAADQIRKAGFKVASVEARPERTTGEIRYYFPEDASSAVTIEALAESAVAQQGERLRLRLRAMDKQNYGAAKQGLIEIWLPPQRAAVKVAIAVTPSSDRELTLTVQALLKAAGYDLQALNILSDSAPLSFEVRSAEIDSAANERIRSVVRDALAKSGIKSGGPERVLTATMEPGTVALNLPPIARLGGTAKLAR